MTWMLNEINKLIWPSPAGIGMMDADAWDRTVKIGLDGEIITAAPSDDAYRTDLAQAAVDALDRRRSGRERGRLRADRRAGDTGRRVTRMRRPPGCRPHVAAPR